MTQHERTMQDLVKIKDLLIIIDKMYDLAYASDESDIRTEANSLMSNAIEVSSGRYYQHYQE